MLSLDWMLLNGRTILLYSGRICVVLTEIWTSFLCSLRGGGVWRPDMTLSLIGFSIIVLFFRIDFHSVLIRSWTKTTNWWRGFFLHYLHHIFGYTHRKFRRLDGAIWARVFYMPSSQLLPVSRRDSRFRVCVCKQPACAFQWHRTENAFNRWIKLRLEEICSMTLRAVWEVSSWRRPYF